MDTKHLLSGFSLFFLASAIAPAEAMPTDLIETQGEDSNITGVAQLSVPNTDVTGVPQLEDEVEIEVEPLNILELSGSSEASEDPMGQVTNVNQLRDVSPGDWAYEALRNLVESYGCIAGYPDGTFRGNRAMTRYEFAAGINSCLQQIERLIAAATDDFVTEDDLAAMQRLSQEFATELAIMRGRVDGLEARTAELEATQFSTTTVMNGEVIFGLATAFGGDPPGGCSILPDGVDASNNDNDVNCSNPGDPANNTAFAHLVRIGLQSSFTGKDRLRMFLTTGNFDNGGFTNPESFNTYMARLGYQADLDNNLILDQLEYRFPILSDRVVVSVIPEGFSLSSVITANSPYFDIGRGSISRFGQLNPILRIGGVLNSGVGADWLITDGLRLQAAYGVGDGNDPDSGIFGADNSVLGVQLLAQPFDNVLAGISYVNAYSSDGTLGTFTGSANAEALGLWSDASVPSPNGSPGNINPNAPSGFGCCGDFIGDQPAQINAVGGSVQWRMAENLTFGAWGGFISADFLDELPNFSELGNSANQKPFAKVATFTLSLGLSDPFGREGDLLAFIFGMPPKLTDAGPETTGVPVPFFERVVRGEDEDDTVTDNNPNIQNGQQTVGQADEATSLHFEVFYRFRVSDNISITPGFFMVTNPGHIEDNDTVFVGTIRTTFRF